MQAFGNTFLNKCVTLSILVCLVSCGHGFVSQQIRPNFSDVENLEGWQVENTCASVPDPVSESQLVVKLYRKIADEHTTRLKAFDFIVSGDSKLGWSYHIKHLLDLTFDRESHTKVANEKIQIDRFSRSGTGTEFFYLSNGWAVVNTGFHEIRMNCKTGTVESRYGFNEGSKIQ